MTQDTGEDNITSGAYRELVTSARVYYKNDKRIDWSEWQHLVNEAIELGLTEADALRAAREAIDDGWSPPLSPPSGASLSVGVTSDSLQARSLDGVSKADLSVSRLRQGIVINGTYRLEAEIGSGGMGVVWRAVHTTLGTKAAIKFLRYAMNEESAARFLREARMAAKLQSRHLARVFDCAQLETGELFIVMEYFDGMGLDQYLREKGPLGVDEAVDFILMACIGLAAAHKRDIVHRDIKPANLFLAVGEDGSREIKIVDFGLSRLAQPEDGEGLTQDQILLGTPEYAPPEQYGNAMSARVPADIWALGATLYCLLSGLPPFPKDPKLSGLFQMSDLLKRVTEEDPSPLSDKRDSIPAELDKVLAKCLQKKPGDRYPNVADLAGDLARFGSDDAPGYAQEVETHLFGSGQRPSRVTALDEDETRAVEQAVEPQPTETKNKNTSSLTMVLVLTAVVGLVVVYLLWNSF